MSGLKIKDIKPEYVREGLERRVIYGDRLMTVILDFTDGPWLNPEPEHAHEHEQSSYLVSGRIIFFCEGEPPIHLRKGDMFFVPSGKKHTIQLLTKKVVLIDNFTPLREDLLNEI